MIRLLISAALFLAAAAIGLLAADQVVDGVDVSASGFVVMVVLYAIVQSVLTPFVTKVAATKAPVLLGGTSLVSTFIALVVATLFGDALTISGGIGTWIAATVIVWVVTAIASLLLPWALVKAGVEKARPRRAARRA
ncbi:phage holin family protein [Nocardioides yefusunii]|uniref:Phage holin family protein n=1 Tax=Nocardioides yefusunii TaxID=2500546 RepID=A0ABW1R0S0_9ACTN|nr:phage holin family protein [Nocardioides yefusunii]